MTSKKDVNGLRGWLVLVGFGLIISPIMVISNIIPAFSQDIFNTLSTPEFRESYPFFDAAIYTALFGNIIILIAHIILLFLFFKYKKSFIKMFIYLTSFKIISIPLGIGMSYMVLPISDQPLITIEEAIPHIKFIIYSAIWIVYMLKSKRVKATFIKD